MNNATAVLENDTHKHIWDFDKQTDCLISDRLPDRTMINKKNKKKTKKKNKENLQNCRLCRPG